MTNEVNFSQFCDSFSDSYSDSYKSNFSYEGKRALFDYFEMLEEDCEMVINLDPIAFCCEYTEYESLEELQKNYNNIKSLEELELYTTVIKLHDYKGIELDSFIIQDY